MENVKDAIRAELEGLSKEELIDIIALFVEVCHKARLISHLNSASFIDECIGGIKAQEKSQINGMCQKLNISFNPKKDEGAE